MRLVVVLGLLFWLGVSTAHARTATGYSEGKKTKINLVYVAGAEVEEATARAFRAMAKAAKKVGIHLSIRSGFRSHQLQQELYRHYQRGWGHLAAKPGFSKHQSGRALDIDLNDATLAWLSRNAKRFGFRQTVRGEPWHWEFGRVSRATARASSKRRRS